jgi:hypothetical protein
MAIDVSKLQVSLEEGERWRRTLSITIPSELVQAERRAAVRQLSSRLKLPGFRAGKIPPGGRGEAVRRRLEQELLDRVIGEAYRGVLADRELRPISEGEVGRGRLRSRNPTSSSRSPSTWHRGRARAPRRFQGGASRRSRSGTRTWRRWWSGFASRRGPGFPSRRGPPRIRRPGRGAHPAAGGRRTEPRRYEFVLGEGEALPEVEASIQALESGPPGSSRSGFRRTRQGEATRDSAAAPRSTSTLASGWSCPSSTTSSRADRGGLRDGGGAQEPASGRTWRRRRSGRPKRSCAVRSWSRSSRRIPSRFRSPWWTSTFARPSGDPKEVPRRRIGPRRRSSFGPEPCTE